MRGTPVKERIPGALPGSIKEIALRLGVTRSSVQQALVGLRADKKVFIGAWRRNTRSMVPVFYPGRSADTMPLPRFTPAQKHQRDWQNRKSSESNDLRNTKRKTYYHLSNALKRPNDWLGPLK